MEELSREEVEAKIVARAWKDADYKQRLLANPKAAFEEALGRKLMGSLEINVVEESATRLFVVLPHIPDTSDELSDVELDAVAGGVGSISRPSVTAGCSTCIPCASIRPICPGEA